LSLDILGYGDLNDYRKTFAIFRDTGMIIRKDNHTFGEIPIKITSQKENDETGFVMACEKIEYLKIETKGHHVFVANGETLDLVLGDRLKIMDVFPSGSKNGVVNFKGFVGNKANNTGEDRGYEIDTATALLRRYSLNNKGRLYQIIVSENDDVVAKFYVRLTPPKLDYLVFKVNDNRHILVRSDEKVSLSMKDKICLEEIQTNLYNGSEVHLHMNGHRIKRGEPRLIQDLGATRHNQLDIRRGPLVLGKVIIHTVEH
jgi:hypothetical protein